MINNFDLIQNILSFEDPGDFYYLQILQRKKDINNTVSSSNHRVVKSYYINSIEELTNRKDKIVELCESNNARAYIWLNPRNTVDVSWTCLQQFTELLRTNNTQMCYRVFDRACGSTPKRNRKKTWIVDIDNKDTKYLETIKYLINLCNGANPNHILYEIPTKNGTHLITEPFAIDSFTRFLKENSIDPIDIHKDNPTLLYYNDLSCK